MGTIAMFETSPLDDFTTMGHDDSVSLTVEAHSLKILVRGNSRDQQFCEAFLRFSGLPCPVDENTCHHGDGRSAFWLGPDETLLRYASSDADRKAASVVQEAEHHFDQLHTAVVDVSDYYCVLTLNGPHAQAVLEKGTPLDLYKALSSAEQCAQTRLGNAPILLSRHNTLPMGFNVQTRLSFAEYLADYLKAGMTEFLAG